MSKLAVVTGATRGIGAVIATTLQSAGYSVVANYYKNDDTAEEFHQNTGIYIQKWNVADYKECQEAITKIEEKFQQNISIIVNNAGITEDRMLHKMSYDTWNNVVHNNLTSCFNMCSLVINKMREQQYGRIVNISSINALTGQVGQANYSAAKAGILGFTKSLARESASKQITVNAIAPGYIKTDMTAKLSPEILNEIVKQVPMGKLGDPQDIARAVLFLVAPEAGFITGHTLSVNGGLFMA